LSDNPVLLKLNDGVRKAIAFQVWLDSDCIYNPKIAMGHEKSITRRQKPAIYKILKPQKLGGLS
jgi:hypothetical protein